ncbi:MAG: hypothetical protein WCL02_05850 [bacterium]
MIEILLIIPSALGNSLLHNVATYSEHRKRKSLGSLLNLMIWFGCLFAVNFWIFADWVIRVTANDSFM